MKLLLMLTLGVFSSSCITTYRGFPKEQLSAPDLPKNPSKLTYFVGQPGMIAIAGGPEALPGLLRSRAPFTIVEPAMAVVGPHHSLTPVIPEKGMFLNVDVKWNPPTIPALVFLGLSGITSTLLPGFSQKEGYEIKYTLYVDGQPKIQRDYEVRRHFYVWFCLLPAIPANLATYTEVEAFEATAKQFFVDAQTALPAANGTPW